MDIGEETLKRMDLVDNYNRWIAETTQPYLGERILEVGSGLGNMTKFFLDGELLVCLDSCSKYLDQVKNRFSSLGNIDTIQCDISDVNHACMVRLKEYKFDTILCFNLLEHIKDDIRGLKNMYNILSPNGRLILLVPALKILYGTLDRNFGHHRRYSKRELISKLKKSEFTIEQIFPFNFLGIFGWFVNSKILKRSFLPLKQLLLFNRIAPLMKRMEQRFKPPLGQSLFAVAKKQRFT